MISRRRFLAGTAAATSVSCLSGCVRREGRIRIGFIVKQPEAQWFQDEWRFAGMAARDRGFDLIRIGAEDGDRVLTAIDNLYAKYAQGFVICAPDPRLGTAIQLRARANDLKLMSVDDRLLGPDGQPIAAIPYLGISASAIGEMAGHEAVMEARRRNWDLAQTGVLRLAFDSLDTGRERTLGGARAAIASGIASSHVFSAPQRTADTEGGFTAADPVLTRQQAIRRWIVLGLNDEAVLGGVRAAEGLGLDAASVIGVGIGGSGTAAAEFTKARPTGFHASVLLSPRRHGYDTTAMLNDWIARHPAAARHLHDGDDHEPRQFPHPARRRGRMTPLLAYRAVGKTFPGVVALDDVSFSVAGGEVRALMGENGAGKSTLLKILAGEYRPDSGGLIVDGSPLSFSSPRDAQAAGIAIIHQELHLAPDLTVTENLLLGMMPTRHGLIDRRAARTTALRILSKLGEDIDPDTKVRALPIGKRQMIEIGKALLRDARIIAFDEPTSSLSARETRRLMRIISDLRAEGRAILYVSHRMEEVFEISESVTVLRDGRHVGDFPDMAALTQDALIAAMAGRTISDIYDYRARTLGAVAVSIDRLAGPGLNEPITLDARKGEILGFFGLVGAGRSELFRLLYGAVRATGGQVAIHGAALSLGDPRRAIAAGLGLCPEDRKDEGIVPSTAVAENIVLARRNLAGGLLVDRKAEATLSAGLIELMRVKTASAATSIATLSGGNQQKAIIARWLAADARILLMDEPTRGIDVGARSEIYAHMYRLAEAGRTILFASSDMPEVMGVADRIVIMREGRIAGIVDRADASPDYLLRLALPDAGRPQDRV